MKEKTLKILPAVLAVLLAASILLNGWLLYKKSGTEDVAPSNNIEGQLSEESGMFNSYDDAGAVKTRTLCDYWYVWAIAAVMLFCALFVFFGRRKMEKKERTILCVLIVLLLLSVALNIWLIYNGGHVAIPINS